MALPLTARINTQGIVTYDGHLDRGGINLLIENGFMDEEKSFPCKPVFLYGRDDGKEIAIINVHKHSSDPRKEDSKHRQAYLVTGLHADGTKKTVAIEFAEKMPVYPCVTAIAAARIFSRIPRADPADASAREEGYQGPALSITHLLHDLYHGRLKAS